jgi:hypothetical protein
MPAMQPQERPGGRVYGGGPGYGEPTSGGPAYGAPTSGPPTYGAPAGPTYGRSGRSGRAGGTRPAGRDPLMIGAVAIGVIGVILGILFATGVFAGGDPPPAPPPASAPASPEATTGG